MRKGTFFLFIWTVFPSPLFLLHTSVLTHNIYLSLNLQLYILPVLLTLLGQLLSTVCLVYGSRWFSLTQEQISHPLSSLNPHPNDFCPLPFSPISFHSFRNISSTAAKIIPCHNHMLVASLWSLDLAKIPIPSNKTPLKLLFCGWFSFSQDCCPAKLRRSWGFAGVQNWKWSPVMVSSVPCYHRQPQQMIALQTDWFYKSFNYHQQILMEMSWREAQ